MYISRMFWLPDAIVIFIPLYITYFSSLNGSCLYPLFWNAFKMCFNVGLHSLCGYQKGTFNLKMQGFSFEKIYCIFDNIPLYVFFFWKCCQVKYSFFKVDVHPHQQHIDICLYFIRFRGRIRRPLRCTMKHSCTGNCTFRTLGWAGNFLS